MESSMPPASPWTAEMRIDHRDGHPFTVKKGDVWTCVKGEPEDTDNTGNSVAIMRTINLLPA